MRGRRAAVLAATLLVTLMGGGLAAAAGTGPAGTESPAQGPGDGVEAITQSPYSDIGPADRFFYDVLWMTDRGIATGWPDGTFRPTAPVTREAAAAFLYRWGLGGSIPACTGSSRIFTDVTAGNPFCGAIEFLAERLIVNGFPDGTFRPSEPISREAFVTILLRGTGQSLVSCTSTTREFTDVTSGNPFCPYIETASNLGIVNGWSDGTFRPALTIERQAIAAMLHRADVLRPTTPADLAGTIWADEG